MSVVTSPRSRRAGDPAPLQVRPRGIVEDKVSGFQPGQRAAAAEPTGDVTLLWRAAGLQGIPDDAAAAAEDAGLIELGGRVRFVHPLVRSAVYQVASAGERRAAHRALAEATDPEADADRRAWHLAHAAPRPDEPVAAELERSAGRAQARGGLAAAAAFLERAAALTPDRARRATRALAAAAAEVQAGAFEAAGRLLDMAEAGPLDESQRARADLLRARLTFGANRGNDAPPLLLKAARRLEPIDAGLARGTYLDALTAAMISLRRPAARTACLNSVSSQALIVVRSRAVIPGRTSCSGSMVGWFLPVETLTVDSTTGNRYSMPNRARCTTRSTSRS